jgi:hypothetical protein
MIYMSREATQPNASTFESPNGPFKWVDATYTIPGAQDWIMLPDREPVSFTLTFPTGGSAYLEMTDCPPNEVLMNIPAASYPPKAPLYPYASIVDWGQGIATSQVSGTLTGWTAIRLQLCSGCAELNVGA